MSTILDWLNEDCWWLVLDFLPTNDIVRSERVSRSWQDVIFRYLQGVGISIEYGARQKLWYGHNNKASHTHRIFRILEDNPEEFKELIEKWGPSIKKMDCTNEGSLEVIRINCPNLEDVTFYGSYGLVDDFLTSGTPEAFKNLKRVHFRDCESLTDKCVEHWLMNYNIENLVIWGAKEIIGKFLETPQSAKLKALCFKECKTLESCRLLSAVKQLKHLKKLELIYVSKEVFQSVHMLLDQLPDLEDLCLRWEKKMELGDEWAESVGRLRLRRLDVGFNPNVTDDWLEKASPGFGRLNELLVERCSDLTGRGAKAACSVAGPALRGLQIGSNVQLCDRYVEEIVRACPNLVWVDLSYCHGITNGIVERVAGARAARDRRLRLLVECTYVEDDEEVQLVSEYIKKTYASLLTYGVELWARAADAERVFRMQRKAVRAVAGVPDDAPCRELFKELNIMPLPCELIYQVALFTHKNLDVFRERGVNPTRAMRSNKLAHLLVTPAHALRRSEKSVYVMGPSVYNRLPDTIKKDATSIVAFKLRLRRWLLGNTFYSVDELYELPTQ